MHANLKVKQKSPQYYI